MKQEHTGSGDNIAGNKIIYQNSPPKTPKFFGTIPPNPSVFIGRDKDLQTIHQKLFGGEQLLLLVNGEGGIGKTTLAAKYYLKHQAEYQHLAWIFVGESLLNALLTLALPLKMNFPPTMPNEQRLSLLLQRMSNLDKPCLLVIDNANRIEDLKNYYQALQSCPNFHLLMTTRITEFQQVAFYKIEHLKKKKAIELFKTHYPKHLPSENTILEKILAAVGYNTLAIELLAKNLRNFNRLKTNYSLIDLLQDLMDKNLLALSRSKKIATAYQAKGLALREETPEAIIGAMYDLGELEAAEKKLLSVFALLPAEAILFATLEVLIRNMADLESPLLSLAQKGWLDFDEAQGTFKVSPVIQEITRCKNRKLLIHCENLIDNLIKKLSFESNTGHLENVTYEEAALYAHYGENIINSHQVLNNDIAVLCERTGMYYQTTGNLLKALTYFEEYQSLKAAFYKNEPDDTYYKDSLAKSLSRLGDTHSSLGNLEKALGFYENYCQIEKELYEAYPQNVSFKNGLAISYQHLGNTHSSLGNLEKALDFYENYHQLEKELYEVYPQNVSFKNGLAVSSQYLGVIHSTLGNLDKALIFFENYNRLEKELYEAYPQNVDFKNGLAVSYQHLGVIHSTLGNLDKALIFYENYNQLEKELYEAYPQNVGFKNSLAISYQYLGKTHSSLGSLEKALGFYENYNQLEKELYEASPQNADFKNNLAISYQYLGITYSSLGNLEKALGFYENYNQLEKELYKVYPQNVSFKNLLAISYQYLGITYSSLGNLEKALGFYENYNQLKKELYEAYPQNVSFKNGLAISYNYLGNTHSSLGNLEKALGFYENYNQLEKELYETYPENMDFKHSLALSYQWLGWTYEKNNKQKEAQQYYQLSAALLVELVDSFPKYVAFKQNLTWVQNKLAENE